MSRLLGQLRDVARFQVPVVLMGEAGTGKSCLARLLHRWAGRREDRAVFVRCGGCDAAKPRPTGPSGGSLEELLRELWFRLTPGGTIVLDSVERLDALGQKSVLSWLDEVERSALRGGAPELQPRVLSTSNADLAAEVDAGRFTARLYYRLSVVELLVPPLRSRVEDIEPLTRAFVRWSAQKHSVGVPAVSRPLVRLLESQPWPGNVRQLREVLDVAVLLQSQGSARLSTCVAELLGAERELVAIGCDAAPARSRARRVAAGIVESAGGRLWSPETRPARRGEIAAKSRY